MKRRRLVIIGLGRIGSELLRRLPKDFDLTCIDPAPDAEERARKLRGDGVTMLVADATSRLTLARAEVDDAECVIISTTLEEVNIEAARLLKEDFRPKRVIAVGTSAKGLQQLAELGADVQDPFSASAAGIRNLLEHRTRTAAAIGLGKDEILEVELHPHSRLANKPLRHLVPLRWRIGVIYRDNNIIVPRGDTVLKAKDRLVILGDPAVLKTVAEIMTFSFEKFPLEYGSTVAACLAGDEDEAFFNELEHLFAVFPLQRLLLVYSVRAARKAMRAKLPIDREKFPHLEERKLDLPLPRAIERIAQENTQDFGLVVLHGSALRPRPLPAVGKRGLLRLCAAASCPVLISRDTHPYVQAAVPAAQGLEPRHSLETALEIASSLNIAVSALLVRPMRHITSEEGLRTFAALRKTVSELGLMYRTEIATETLDGNPVHAVLSALKDQNLLLLDAAALTAQRWPLSLLDPDPTWHLLRKAPLTTLLVPHVEEAL